MREIKFRYYFKSKSGIVIHQDFTLVDIELGMVDDFIASEEGELGETILVISIVQYSGLRDKNEKDLYEEDVVVIKTHYDGDKLIPEMNGVVIFISGAFMVYNKQNMYYSDIDDNLYTIIGNIHENPELVKEG